MHQTYKLEDELHLDGVSRRVINTFLFPADVHGLEKESQNVPALCTRVTGRNYLLETFC